MIEQLRGMADSKTAFPQQRAGLILQTFWIAHQRGRRVGVDRRSRHLVVGVKVIAVMERLTPMFLFGSLLGELWTEPCPSGPAPMIPAQLVHHLGARLVSLSERPSIQTHILPCRSCSLLLCAHIFDIDAVRQELTLEPVSEAATSRAGNRFLQPTSLPTPRFAQCANNSLGPWSIFMLESNRSAKKHAYPAEAETSSTTLEELIAHSS